MATTVFRRLLAAATLSALAAPALAAHQPGFRVGSFEDGRVVVQPGQIFGWDQNSNNCTTGFIAADEAYLAGHADGRRYLVTAAHCINGTGDLDGSVGTFTPEERVAQYLKPMHTTWVMGNRLPVGDVERFGVGYWRDESPVLGDAGTGEFFFDAGIALLDDDVSVDPAVPELGVPADVHRDFISLQEDPAGADLVSMYGRGIVAGDVGGQPTLARRDGVLYGEVADRFLCTTIPVVSYDSGSPVMAGEGAAGIAHGYLSFNSDHWVQGHEEQLCQGGGVMLRVDAILEAFEQDTGIRLHLLTERAGPILR